MSTAKLLPLAGADECAIPNCPEHRPLSFITCENAGAWAPTGDFVYFRKIKAKEVRTKGGIIVPDFSYMQNSLPNGGQRLSNRVEEKSSTLLCECIAAGPGRLLPNGALRTAPCKPGQIFQLSGQVNVSAIVTEFIGDDGDPMHCVEGVYIIGVRDGLPPWALTAEVEPEAPAAKPEVSAN